MIKNNKCTYQVPECEALHYQEVSLLCQSVESQLPTVEVEEYGEI